MGYALDGTYVCDLRGTKLSSKISEDEAEKLLAASPLTVKDEKQTYLLFNKGFAIVEIAEEVVAVYNHDGTYYLARIPKDSVKECASIWHRFRADRARALYLEWWLA